MKGLHAIRAHWLCGHVQSVVPGKVTDGAEGSGQRVAWLSLTIIETTSNS